MEPDERAQLWDELLSLNGMAFFSVSCDPTRAEHALQIQRDLILRMERDGRTEAP